jgi:hypothetical protein
MTLSELQSCLDRLGVKLSLQLVVGAPAGAMTPEVKHALATHKPALLAMLAVGSPPVRPDWDRLSRERWGPAVDDSAPGIVIDRPARGMIAFVDDPEERAAIMEFDGGLTRADAERLAGIAPGGIGPQKSAPTLPPWPPRPDELADWPIPWRKRWGEVANTLQDTGVPWPEHEQLAFDQIKAKMAKPHVAPVAAVAEKQTSLFDRGESAP